VSASISAVYARGWTLVAEHRETVLPNSKGKIGGRRRENSDRILPAPASRSSAWANDTQTAAKLGSSAFMDGALQRINDSRRADYGARHTFAI
jgi:hypothetical protein